MEIKDLSVCIATHKVKECTAFYQNHFSGKITFNCGWYINLELAESSRTIQFMEPQGDGKPFAGQGITLNFSVKDVDAEYEKLKSKGINILQPIDDHPWGDRGFGIEDPAGNTVYIYTDIEPTEEYAEYYI